MYYTAKLLSHNHDAKFGNLFGKRKMKLLIHGSYRDGSNMKIGWNYMLIKKVYFLQPGPLPRLDSNRQFCLCVCLSPALEPLTDKMDPKCIIASESASSHDDARPKKNILAILDF